MNLGYIEAGGGNTTVVVHYDINAAYPQPLVDIASGFCLEVTTAAAAAGTVLLAAPGGTNQHSTQAPLTAAQLSALGFNTRADITFTAQ